MEHQIHFGKKFYKDHKTGYWISTSAKKIRAHVWVWTQFHGKPPKGYHVHHRNEDKSDNRIENLEIIHASRHLSIHMQLPERKQRAREMANKYRPLTKEWHSSPEGLAWHKLHAYKCKFGKGEYHKYNCQQCSKEYESRLIAQGRTRFCSNACKSKWRRAEGLDNIDKPCEKCGKIFSSNKYIKQRFCGRACSAGINQFKKTSLP